MGFPFYKKNINTDNEKAKPEFLNEIHILLFTQIYSEYMFHETLYMYLY